MLRIELLHCRRSDKSWTKGGEEGMRGKEHLPQDPVLLKCLIGWFVIRDNLIG